MRVTLGNGDYAFRCLPEETSAIVGPVAKVGGGTAQASPGVTPVAADGLHDVGSDSTRYVLDGADHGDLSFMGGDPATGLPWSTEEVADSMIGFLSANL